MVGDPQRCPGGYPVQVGFVSCRLASPRSLVAGSFVDHSLGDFFFVLGGGGVRMFLASRLSPCLRVLRRLLSVRGWVADLETTVGGEGRKGRARQV